MRILALDIETRPAVVVTFQKWKPHISDAHVLEPTRLLCFSYQWSDQKKVGFYSEYHDGRQTMLDALYEMLTQADVILTYNGKTFDYPWITGELLVEGYPPIPPVQHIDLYQLMKSKTRLFSRTLNATSDRLLGERKVEHAGMALWVGCMQDDPKSWATMKKYAVQDTALLLPFYERVKGWFTTGHPNVGVIDGVTEAVCRICGSDNIQKRGWHHKTTGSYRRWQCMEIGCGAWSSDKSRLRTTELRGV